MSLVLLLSTLFAIGTDIYAATSGTCGDSAQWYYDAETTTLTISGTGAINNYNALVFRAPWRDYKPDITTIVVEEGITRIGQYNFYNCVSLKNVSLPSTLTVIGGYGDMSTSYGAFQACTALESITLPSNLETIENCAFKGCTALKTLSIPDSVTSLGYGAFCECTALTTVTFGDGLTETGLNTFYNDNAIKKIYWGNTVEKITSYSFFGYGGTELSFPSQIKEIGCRSFADNYYLRKVTIENPDCVISTVFDTEVSSPFAGHEQDLVTVYGHKGSTSESFAAQFNYPFVSLDNCDHEQTVDITTTEPTCTETGVLSTICTSCGQIVKNESIPATGHTYEVIESVDCTDIDGHVYSTERCTVCDNVEDIITHQKLENGDTNYLWVDGYYDYSNSATCTRPGIEKYTCLVEGCGQTESHVSTSSHSVSEWSTTLEPTCTEEGERQGLCATCGEVVTEKISPTGHFYEDNDLMVDIDAVSDDGHIHHIYICQNCGSQIDVPEHVEWVEGFYTATVISEPHCVVDGLERDNCDICDETRNVVLPAIGEHMWYETSRTEPTCTSVGKIYYACENCNMTKAENIQELGHDYVVIEENSLAATCTEPGYNYQTCQRCSATQKVTIPAAGHTVDKMACTVVSEADCENDGLILSMCSVCGVNFEKTIPALGHDYVDVSVDLTSEGKPGHYLVTPTCSRCSSTQTSSVVHEEWLDEYTKELDGGLSPTCEVPGYTREQCTICGKINRIPIEAIGHRYYYSGLNNSEGLMVYDCATCHVSTYIANPIDVYALWNKKYANTQPSRTTVDNSSLLDMNGDNFINGKDFAMILQARKTYLKTIENYQRITLEVNGSQFTAALYDKTASTELAALCPMQDVIFTSENGYAVSNEKYNFTPLPVTVSEMKTGEIYVDSDDHILIALIDTTLESTRLLTKIGYIENTQGFTNAAGNSNENSYNISLVERSLE